MSSVFTHGRLRLYLLKLLEESPRHGYEVIRLLEDRFLGLYAPSPGTVYPRLQRLEAEGLVTHTETEGGRKVYAITDAGRQELARRRGELDALEADIRVSVRELAREIRDEVKGTVRDFKQELKQAARELRRQQRHENRWDRGAWTGLPGAADQAGAEPRGTAEGRDGGPDAADARSFERRLQDFLGRVHLLARRAALTEAQLRECAAILEDALERIRAVLRQED